MYLAYNTKRTAIAAAMALGLGASAALADVTITVTTMDFYPASSTSTSHVNPTVSGSINFTTGTGNFNSGGTNFFGDPWTADVQEVYLYDTVAGGTQNFNFSTTEWTYFGGGSVSTCREITGSGTCSAPPGAATLGSSVIADYSFTLTEATQYAAALFFDWSGNLDIPVLAVFDCAPGGDGATCIPVDSDNDSTPGTDMLTAPFPGQTAAFIGILNGVGAGGGGVTVTVPSVTDDMAATFAAGTIAPGGDGTVTLSQVISAGIPTDSGATQQCVGGCFDFTVSGLSGSSVTVVLPLSAPIPAAAVYRKWNGTDWVNFDTAGDNAIASAAGSGGECPTVGYTQGLTKGHSCVRLTIVDGGPNDLDGEINGTIVDPGGVAEKLIPTATTSLGSGIGGGCTLATRSGTGIPGDWLLIGGLLAGLGLYRRRLMS